MDSEKKLIIFEVKDGKVLIKAQDVNIKELMEAHSIFTCARIDDAKIDFMSFSEKVINEFKN